MEASKQRETTGRRTDTGAPRRIGRRPAYTCDVYGEREEEVKTLIRAYPRLRAELQVRERDLIHERTEWAAGILPRARRTRPTEMKTVRIDADDLVRMLRMRCSVVGRSLARLRPEHRRVICLRFWGVAEHAQAIARVHAGAPLCGLRFGSTRGLESVEELAGYSERQAGRIVRKFVAMVVEELEQLHTLEAGVTGGF